MRWLVVCAVACAAGGVRAQPIQCSEDHQCSSGSYCNPELHFCLACLSCQSLKREPPPLAATCVRYVTECGPCMKGLVASLDGGDGCSAPADAGLPAYIWTIIALCLLLFCAFVIAVLVYILRHKDTFKFTSATSVETQRAPREPAPPTAPPPYDGQFDTVRPSSPPLAGTPESEAPLVKRAGSSRAGGGSGARETAARQAARVFNNPHYVRGPHLPPEPPTYEEAFSDGSDQETGFVPPPDEDTMESLWTPDGPPTSAHTEAAGTPAVSVPGTSGATALVRRPERSELAPPAKVHCVREDTNNNRGGGESSGSGRPPAPAPAPTLPAALVINVMNVNTVHQLNDLSL